MNLKKMPLINRKTTRLSDNWEILWVALLSLVALQLFFGFSLSSSNSLGTTEHVSSWADDSFSDSNTEVPVGPETRQFTQERIEE